jgi:hypothetical protein
MIARTRLAAVLPAAALATGAIFAAPALAQTEAAGPMSVVKSPTCGCCSAWVAIAEGMGYEVEATDLDDMAEAKRAAGVPEPLWACHTAEIAGYVVEGHVPFEAIERLLEERPEIDGIAVPGMPMGSPGMGDDPTAVYDVIAWGGEAGPGEVFYTAGEGS